MAGRPHPEQVAQQIQYRWVQQEVSRLPISFSVEANLFSSKNLSWPNSRSKRNSRLEKMPESTNAARRRRPEFPGYIQATIEWTRSRSPTLPGAPRGCTSSCGYGEPIHAGVWNGCTGQVR